MIRDFVQWTAAIVEQGDLTELRSSRVGIEAADYLNQRILNHPRAKEPLVPALGGLPLALTQHIEEDLATFRSHEIEPYFIFSGLDLTKQGNPFGQKTAEATVNADAWNLYDSHQAEASVAKFGESTYVTPEDLFRALQSILTKQNVRWQVAPYSAWAQLAYCEKNEYVHAVAGSSDLLIFECAKVITSWDFEARQFSFIRREKCVADLSKFVGASTVTDDIFLDTCLLAGTPFLPTLPILDAPNRADLLKPHSAIKMIMNTTGQSGFSVVVSNNDVPPSGKEYVTRYQKARLAVKNHPVYTEEGKVEPQNSASMPNDAGQYLGQRLPDEILHYMSRGLINARILQWRTTCEVFEVPPMDGGESPEYRNLVSVKLIPLRTAAINLLSSSLHNWYRHKPLEQTNWFSITEPTRKSASTTIHVERPSEAQSPSIVDTWNVKEAVFKDAIGQYKDADFVSKTIAKKNPKNPLSTAPEILYNSIWRFLALREYVDVKTHSLTQWGKVLAAVISGLKGKAEHEAAVLAVELIRMGLLISDINMFPTYNGAPMRGSSEYIGQTQARMTDNSTAKDKNANMLVSRVAGLGILHHRPIGFTGPLSQHLLGYNSIINVVRQTLRDLVEVAATHMFATGCCNRHADISAIAMQLPFLLPNNCALSIAVKSYLDELLSNDADPTSPETKARVVDTASMRYFPQSLQFETDLKMAFSLWDAIYAGVNSANNTTIPEATKQIWTETDKWLSERR
ncbi:XPG N-terminal domain containing protein [Pyrenophora tritici-repentis Pt-1C-BFP]|uniref:XPG N-terminal domain containing protein n=1 Tax=Pyrenophora tritici-repentis (strain Pt-1C-BFP) TaxID=426418 RepID=B2W7P8_PYRTR|nr:XPG N-terminal domain containing protein [Pyrenophora tritici-repentis Pt-1C-BFP]EDU48756.1 XPG N-terminal domain containing protein [Pyrenophora tritici-repentis Pt-1C-BFP]